jgi:mannose PTS system EIIA component
MSKEKRKPAGIVVTHGRLAEELIRTAELIVGKLEDVHAISGSDLCSDSIIETIRKIISGSAGRKVVVFVDYFGGSCSINSMRAVEGMEDVKVISGVNLPLLLDFATKRESMGFDTMVEHIVRRGKESVKLIEF